MSVRLSEKSHCQETGKCPMSATKAKLEEAQARVLAAMVAAGWIERDGGYLQEHDKGWCTKAGYPYQISPHVEQYALAQFAYWPDEYATKAKAQKAAGDAVAKVFDESVVLFPESPNTWQGGKKKGENFYAGEIQVSLVQPLPQFMLRAQSPDPGAFTDPAPQSINLQDDGSIAVFWGYAGDIHLRLDIDPQWSHGTAPAGSGDALCEALTHLRLPLKGK